MREIPKPGEFYRHFKNRLYQVVAVAAHSETGEKMVVYQALYGDFAVYVRPLSMFMEPVDRVKYPDVYQKDRFERITPGEETLCRSAGSPPVSDAPAVPALSPLLMEFLDAETCEEQMAVLQCMKGKVGQTELDSLYLSLDMKPCGGTVDGQLDNLKQYLNMQQRFDASRLRRS